MVTAHLGIDVSKAKLDACLLVNPSDSSDDRPIASVKLKHIVVSNDEEGFQALIQWLSRNKINNPANLHSCMEATAHYSNAIARFLVEYGCVVSVVNPAAVRAFAVTYL